MKCKNYGKGLLVATLLLCSSHLWAYDFSNGFQSAVNGRINSYTIYYSIVSSADLTCKVTYKDENYNSYSGDIIIPDVASYNGKAYTVVEIGERAFYNCSGLTLLMLYGENFETISPYAFQSCTSLTSATLGNSVKTIGEYAFYDCHSMVYVNIPDGVTEIERETFNQCSSLTSITFPENVTSIGHGACSGCESLTELILGKSVTFIDEFAFNYCDKLESITSLNPEPPKFRADNVFVASVKASCPLYVPNGSKDAYSVAEVWKDFLDIDEIGTMGMEDVLSDSQAEEVARYTIDGRQINAPQKGVNIIRYSDGTVQKVFEK